MSAAQNLMEAAGYAYTTLEPIIDRLNEQDPDLGARLYLTLNFKSDTVLSNTLSFYVFAGATSSGNCLTSSSYANAPKVEIDKAAAKLEAMLTTPVPEPVG